MVLDLFAEGPVASPRRGGGTRRGRGTTPSSPSHPSSGRRRPTRDASGSAAMAEAEEDRKLFTNCVSQVQRHLKTHIGSPSTLHTFASYYTRVEPFIEGRPFCVSLSYATFLFHMQMARIGLADVDLYIQLIANAMSQLSDDQRLTHPFVLEVLRDHIFGLPSPTCHGGAHCVVLVPPQLYRAYAHMSTALLALDVVPIDVVYQFQDKLEVYCSATSPIVANRALALLVQTVAQVRIDEQITALQYVLRAKPVKMNVDFLLACYERLKRAVADPAHGPTFGRALSIHCSELFLRLRSPIRREYVERFLYPSLCHPDMSDFLAIPVTRRHLVRELLAQCPPGLSTTNPFYMCLCAVMQDSFDDEIEGALETVTLINCQMPHAAYFMAALAVDMHMSVSMFAKVVIALARGAGMAMAARDSVDEVAVSIKKDRTSVYNVLFMLREVVRSCSITASRRATDMLKALRVAMPMKTIEALGKLSEEAFDGTCDITVDPQLLCAELAMVLHHEHIVEAMDSAVDYFRDVTAQCHYCGAPCSASLLCPVNGTVHVTGQSSVSRVLLTLAECAGAKVVQDKLIQYMRDPRKQMDSAVHFLVYHILSNAGQHRNTLFVAVEPYIRSTLMALVSADRGGSGSNGLIGSEQKANVLMLHVKLVTLLASSIDPSYLESIVKVVSELKLRTNHDALGLWYMGNLLLRNCKGTLEILPTDPAENHYCVDYPGCAPASATCADNAQLVLKLLDRAHGFSPEMRKLVGCCVCKLLQDFNMQAPNITGALLSSHGFSPIGLASLSEFALPVGAGSTFWGYFLNQMKTSAPARTSFMTSLAKSMAVRFRIASPAEAVPPYGIESTGHLFSLMMYEAIKRSAPLARVVLFMVSNWMKQGDHKPGKFVALVYMCTQLTTAVMQRGVGPAAVELEAETPQDKRLFDDCVSKAARTLGGQRTRLERLLPAARGSNIEFFRLVRRLQRKVRRTVAEARGEPLEDGDDVESGYESADAREYARHYQHQQSSGPEVAVEDLHNAADDSIFHDDAYAAAGTTEGGDELDHYYDGEDQDIEEESGDVAIVPPAAPGRVSAALQALHLNTTPAPAGAPAVKHTVDKSSSTSTVMVPSSSSGNDDPPSSGRATDAVSGPHRRYHPHNDIVDADGGDSDEADVDVDVDGEVYDEQYTERTPGHSHYQHSSRSQSKGVQTDDEETSTAATGKHASPAIRPARAGDASAAHRKRSVDKGVTVPFERSIGTSPIAFEEAPARPPPRRTPQAAPRRSEVTGGVASSHKGQQPQNRGTDASPQGRESIWNEPDLFDYTLEGDATPIDDTDVPYLQATTGDGVVLPSGMVLEYLRTHQGMDSLRHELYQLDQSSSAYQQVAQYVASAATAMHEEHRHQPEGFTSVRAVTVEGRPNNYGQPHMDASRMASSRRVLAPVHMVDPRPQSQGHTRGGGGEVVDGEHDISAVSGAVELSSKRRRTEQQPQPQGSAPVFRGMQFFLNQNAQAAHVQSALQDLHGIQQQRTAMDALAQQSGMCHRQPHPQGGSSAVDGADVNTPVAQHRADDVMPSSTTPYGQVIIPACLVEQRNSTAVKELRQVMGAYDPNDSRLSTSGKRQIRGNGQAPAGDGVENSGGSAWWAEMSTAPMPHYAVDPEYSMELF